VILCKKGPFLPQLIDRLCIFFDFAFEQASFLLDGGIGCTCQSESINEKREGAHLATRFLAHDFHASLSATVS
jgi:hypothetical protein